MTKLSKIVMIFNDMSYIPKIKSGSLSHSVSDKVTYWAVRWQLKKGKSKDANLVVVPFASWGVDLNRIDFKSKCTNAGDSACICKETIPHGTAAIRKLAVKRKEKQERSQAGQLPHSCWWSVWKVWSWKRKKRFLQLLVAQLQVKHSPPATLI